MIDFLNNPWVTGIGGGIISSLIVFFATRYLFNKKENKEYNQKIQTANNEILYSLRPLIIEKNIPSSTILLAICTSIAQKYNVKQEDLYNEISLYNELVTEIMGNAFLSSEQKIDYCESLQEIKTKDKNKTKYIYVREKASLNSKLYSIVLSVTSFSMVITMTLSLAESLKPNTSIMLKDNILLVLTSICVPLVTLTIVLEFYIIKNRRRRHELDEKIKKADKNQDDINN